MKRIGNALISTTVKALAQSMNTHTMVALAAKLIPNYNLHKRTGFPTSIPVPNKDAARQIVTDMANQGLFMDFVLLLVEVGQKGLMGKKYSIPYMKEIISGIFDMGYLYDSANQLFVENPASSITRNWGALNKGREYIFAFMRLDIAGNTMIVRENNINEVQKSYDDLRDTVTKAVLKRNGRIWSWDGDGGLGAFFFGNRQQSAVMAGKEILHELFFYNLMDCRLKNPLQIRVAVHSGAFEYTADEEELKASETVKRVMEIESMYTKPQTMTISTPVKLMLDSIAGTGFSTFTGGDRQEYYSYELKQEKK